MKLFNPGLNEIEFMYGGQPYSIAAGETKEFPDKVAGHCLRSVNSPIVEAETTEVEPAKEVVEETSLESMDWNELRRFGKGTYVPGMTRVELTEALENA